MADRLRPDAVRDAIVEDLRERELDAAVTEIHDAVGARLGGGVPASSVRSYLRLNDGDRFQRTGRGRYALRETLPLFLRSPSESPPRPEERAVVALGRALLGVEIDPHYVAMAQEAIPRLARLASH